jgi:Flp pilus assembly protein TadB
MGAMNTIGFILGTCLLVGGSAFFTIRWSQIWRVEARKTELQKRREEIDYQASLSNRQSLAAKIKRVFSDYGWEGDVTPLLMVSGVLYLVMVSVLSIIGIQGVPRAILALPASLLIVGGISASAANKKKRLFNKQLMQALDLFAAQLKSGLSSVRAMEQTLPSLPQPLRGELAVALEKYRASAKLGDALAEVQERFPSRAMQMLVVSVRIDEERGGRMADALEQAADNVRKDFELGAEAQAELAQEKAQFYGIVFILGMFAYVTLARADENTIKSFTTMPGSAIIFIAAANALFGIFRTLRVFSKAKGEI